MSRPQSGEDVDVVPHSTHRVRNTVHSTNNATEVIMNTRALRGRKPRLPAFRTEDQVIVQRNIGRGHDAKFLSLLTGAQSVASGKIRWFRCAAPPATGFQAFGLAENRSRNGQTQIQALAWRMIISRAAFESYDKLALMGLRPLAPIEGAVVPSSRWRDFAGRLNC